MVRNQTDLEQTRHQLQGMEEAVAELMNQSDSMHPSQLSLLLEGPMEMVRRLRAEIDEYLGIERAAALLDAQCADASDR
jgi:hypothetical protein